MATKTYWEKRMEQLFAAQDKQNHRLDKQLRKEILRIEADIRKEIARYYQEYGKENVIEYRHLVQNLSQSEIDLLYQDYEAFAKKYPQYAHLMPVRESIYRLNRLEGLALSIRLKMVELGAFEQEGFEKLLREAYENGYLSTMKGLEHAPSFFHINESVMRMTLNAKWINGQNFSDRIWANKEKLIYTLNQEIRDGIIRGDDYRQMARIIQNRLEVGANESLRLIATESAFVMNQANKQAFMDAGIQRYQITAVLDHRTSPTCRRLNGEIFEFQGAKVGVNYPPFHPFCRTTVIPIENVTVPEEKKVKNVIPYLESAKIDDKKLFRYVLNKEHKVGGNKAVVFEKVLGYNETNGELLRKEVLEKLPDSYAELRKKDKHGIKYTTYIPLVGMTNRSVWAIAGWILENNILRLTTLYIPDQQKQVKIEQKIKEGGEAVD